MAAFRFFNSNHVLNFRNLLCSRNTLKNCDEQRASITHRALEKLGIPLPPKRPMSPYIKFVQMMRPKLLQEQPNLAANELVKVAAREWSHYDPEIKKTMQEEYHSQLQVYLSNFAKYKETITPEQKELIQSQKLKLKRAKENAQISQKKLSMGRPKKPSTSFLKFLVEKKAQRRDTMSYPEWLKHVGKEWENLSELEKNKYKEETKAELDKYKAELLAWEETMIREGHLDIVRNKELLDSKSIQKRSSKNKN